MTRKGRRQKLKDGDEYDAIGGWRHVYKYLDRAGIRKAIKKRLNKRARREVKNDISRAYERDTDS